jgi:predicted DNA repair protein MutK
VVGTAAMFLVGGGILTHGAPVLHHGIEHLAQLVGNLPGLGGLLAALTPTLLDGGVGIVAGALVLGAISLWQRIRKPQSGA